MTLRLGPDLKVPDDAVTGAIALLAVKGAGKSNAARVMAEEMHRAGFPWVAIDPKGDWWGIRADGDGGKGLPVPILGGLRGDLPLEPQSGAFVADLIADQNLTAVLDVSEFSKREQARFLTDFGERLFRRHGRDRQPRHLFLEEADEYLPQRVYASMAPCVGMWSRIVKQGRQRGLGITLISQRSAVVNKDALTQTEALIALRTTSPQDRKAIGAWIDYHAVSGEVLATLPSLADGEAWVCSPHWLGVVERSQFRRSRTFDSGSTPAVSGERRPVAHMSDLDLDALREQMAETVERAEADDPKALRKRLAEAERKLAALDARPVETTVERVEVPTLSVDDVDLLRTVLAEAEALQRGIAASIDAAVRPLCEAVARAEAPASIQKPARAPQPAPIPDRPTAPRRDPTSELPKAQRAILGVLATHHPNPVGQVNVAVLTGYSHKSGNFSNALSALRTAGLIERGNPIGITLAGLDAVGDNYERTPTDPAALISWWRGKLGKAAGAILQAVFDAGQLSVAEIAERTGYSQVSGNFSNALSRLRSLGLVTGYGGAPIEIGEMFQ